MPARSRPHGLTLPRSGPRAGVRFHRAVDGLPPGEGAFLACSFWLADALALTGRRDEARKLFLRLRDLRNDLGLLSEEYDAREKRLVGNFPQAFSHIAFVNSACVLGRPEQGQNA